MKNVGMPVQRHCPNCGELGTGYLNSDGATKMSCRMCGTVFVSRPKGRRHDCMDIYAPKGAVLREYCWNEEAM